MYKYLLTGTAAALMLMLAHNAQASSDRPIMNYGYFGDQFDETNCPGSNEFFDANKMTDVNFDFNRSGLKRHEKGKHTVVTITMSGVNYNKLVLDRHAKYLKDHPFTDVHVLGYTDIRGSHAYNKKLGMRRAMAVKKYLVKQGVDANRIHIVSVGEDKVMFKNHPDNRHVTDQIQD